LHNADPVTKIFSSFPCKTAQVASMWHFIGTETVQPNQISNHITKPNHFGPITKKLGSFTSSKSSSLKYMYSSSHSWNTQKNS